MSAIQIRKASFENAKAIRQIYTPYIFNTPLSKNFKGASTGAFAAKASGKRDTGN